MNEKRNLQREQKQWLPAQQWPLTNIFKMFGNFQTPDSLGPHCPKRWALWLVENYTSIMVAGLNSQALTSNPIISLKCSLKKKLLSHQPPHVDHLKTSSRNSPGRIMCAPGASIFKQKPKTMKTRYQWLLVSLQLLRVFVLSLFSMRKKW